MSNVGQPRAALNEFLERHMMANPEHLRILGEGVEVWNQWRATRARTTSVDLIEAELSQAMLDHANLRLAKLDRANLTSGSSLGSEGRGQVLHASIRAPSAVGKSETPWVALALALGHPVGHPVG